MTAAARELPVAAASELARRVTEIVVLATQEDEFDLSNIGDRRGRYIGALRAVAQVLGHPPSTTEYQIEYERRQALNEGRLPVRSSIIKFYGGWLQALTAAGLAGPAPVSRTERRRRRQRKRPAVYPKERLLECLRACAYDLGRTPSVLDYNEWREDHLPGRPGDRPLGSDVPHHQTVVYHYGTWPAALEAAGLPVGPEERVQPNGWSRVSEETT